MHTGYKTKWIWILVFSYENSKHSIHIVLCAFITLVFAYAATAPPLEFTKQTIIPSFLACVTRYTWCMHKYEYNYYSFIQSFRCARYSTLAPKYTNLALYSLDVYNNTVFMSCYCCFCCLICCFPSFTLDLCSFICLLSAINFYPFCVRFFFPRLYFAIKILTLQIQSVSIFSYFLSALFQMLLMFMKFPINSWMNTCMYDFHLMQKQ